MVTTAPLWRYGQDIAFTRPARSVHTVYLHCSASDVASHDDVSVIKAWHLERNFGDIGYHYFINKNGNVQAGRALESIPIAQAPHNTGSIVICCHRLAEANFTAEQYATVIKLCTAIRDACSPSQIRFRGHCEVSTKTCPVYHYRSVPGLDAWVKPRSCRSPAHPDKQMPGDMTVGLNDVSPALAITAIAPPKPGPPMI